VLIRFHRVFVPKSGSNEAVFSYCTMYAWGGLRDRPVTVILLGNRELRPEVG
jgi:hypothetical protein